MTIIKKLVLSPTIIFFFAFAPNSLSAQDSTPKYQLSVSQSLYDSIVKLDSIFFDAYNKCKINTMDSLLSEDLEFYHDKGGFSNSKNQTMEAIKKNICGKVTRDLLKGSIEVYEIRDYGAIQIGFHGFHNNQERETGPTHFSKFINIWQKKANRWQISRVISLH
jgi:hypothetical protein